MKNTIIKIGILLALLFTAACADSGNSNDEFSQGNRSVDSKGNCTEDFIAYYNAVQFELLRIRNGDNNAKATKKACARLTLNHGSNVTCTERVDDYEARTINVNDLIQTCNLIWID